MSLRKPFLLLFAGAMLFVAFSAFGASSAAATSTEECKVEEEGDIITSQHFADSNCEIKTGAEGLWHTAKIKPKSELKVTKTSIVAVEIEPAGNPAEISCETLSGNITASNYEREGKFGFEGEGKLQLSSCKVTKPAGCTVKPIETVPLSVSSEDLPEEVMRTLYAPSEGSKLATITVEGCAISGSYALEGKLRAQAPNIHSEEFSASSGSELTVSKKPAMITGSLHAATVATGKTIVHEFP